MKGEWCGRWDGRTVVCIASGPSLTAADCELVRAAGYPTIVTNTTFRIAPWADVLFGMDAAWWAEYHKEVEAAFKGARLTTAQHGRKFGATSLFGQPWFRGYGNSGTCALSLAVSGGASKVLMLGYDAQKTGGKVHWHGDHPAPMSNGRSIKTWAGKFAQVAAYAKRHQCRVVNVSRETALTCFERGVLEDEL